MLCGWRAPSSTAGWVREPLPYPESMSHPVGKLQPPAYALGSVDKALRVLHMLRDGGPVRISVVARDLDIAVSTAHRIMSMLVFHGFAVQDDQRRYLPGPALSAPVLATQDVDRLIRTAGPVIERLAEDVGETANLTTRVGPHIRVLMAAGTHGRAEMDRSGAVLAAHSTAAGRASLAMLSGEQLEHLFRGPAAERNSSQLDDRGFADLRRELALTRAREYALSRVEAVERLSAVAVPVPASSTRAVAVALLTTERRLDPLLRDRDRMRALYRAAEEIAARLDAAESPPS